MTKRISVTAAVCLLAVGLTTACTTDPPEITVDQPGLTPKERYLALLKHLEAGEGQPQIAGDWKQVAGRNWILERLDGGPLEPGSEVTISFSGESRIIQGQTDTGTYNGIYWFRSGSGLRIAGLSSDSHRYLRSPVLPMEQDGRYLRLLEQVDAFRLDGEVLMLFVRGRPALVYLAEA